MTLHIHPDRSGAFKVRRTGVMRAWKVFPNRKSAVAFCRKLHARTVIHNLDGTVLRVIE